MSPSALSVLLPTSTLPSRIQEVVGKRSLLSPDVEEFRGIPYASIPGRWKHSVLRTELPSNVFDATRNGPKCPQPSEPNNSRTFQGHVEFPTDVAESEFECLNLFIQRPSKEVLTRIGKENEELPVLVWFHGGGFGFGAGTDPMWDPVRLVLQSVAFSTPIIVVSINYRLNIFGFLSSPSLLSIQPPNKGLNFGL